MTDTFLRPHPTARELLELILGERHGMHSVAAYLESGGVLTCCCTCGRGFKAEATKENLHALRNVGPFPTEMKKRSRVQ